MSARLLSIITRIADNMKDGSCHVGFAVPVPSSDTQLIFSGEYDKPLHPVYDITLILILSCNESGSC